MKSIFLVSIIWASVFCQQTWGESLSAPATSTAVYASTTSSIGSVASVPAVTLNAPFKGLTVNEIQTTRVVLAWSQNYSDEQGYVVERADYNGNVVTYTLPKDVLKYVDSKVTADTLYRYRVYAFKGGVKTEAAMINLYTNPARPLPASIESCKVQVISSCDRVFTVKASVGKVGGTAPKSLLPAPALGYCALGDADRSVQAICAPNTSYFDGNLTFRAEACSDNLALIAQGYKESALSPYIKCESQDALPNW